MLAAGYFTPLNGFMNKSDALSVGQSMHTTSGLFWPTPVLNLIADAGDFKGAFKRAKKMDGYRWVMLNADDLFKANTLSISSRAGMITPQGKVLKNARL